MTQKHTTATLAHMDSRTGVISMTPAPHNQIELDLAQITEKEAVNGWGEFTHFIRWYDSYADRDYTGLAKI